jgi:thioredoxin 1
MKKHKLLFLLSFVFFLIYLSFFCSREQRRPSGEDPTAVGDSSQSGVIVTDNLDLDFSKHKVTFIELGADRCIPCRAMQPIMREIAVEYSGKIQVVFYDVWKDPRPARKYGIQLIPTQVFIDQKGKEIFRHVGFFPKEEILGMLKEKGIL